MDQTKNIKILVADDEENIVNFIAYTLERENYTVEKAYDGIETLDLYYKFRPDLIILDIMMPGYDGYEIAKKLKDESVGIIMLTAKTDLIDRIVGLDLGADDYLTKPFEMVELLARVRSVSRRILNKSDYKDQESINTGDLEINLRSRIVAIKGEAIDLTAKEFDLLVFLFRNQETVFSRETILSYVWDMDYLGGTRTIDIHIQRIRRKLGEYGKLIVTIPTVGYKALTSLE